MSKHRATGQREHLGWWGPIIGIAAAVAVAFGFIVAIVVKFS